MSMHTRRATPTEGSIPLGCKSPRVAISFDRAMFERLAGEASRRRLPFAEIVREKILQALREEEAA